MNKFKTTGKSPPPLGHYSQAFCTENLVFVSVQIPVIPGRPDEFIEDVEGQAEQVLKNVLSILEHAGCDRSRIARITIYLTDMADWETVNKVYTKFMGDNKPARGVLQIGGLHKGYKVAMDAIGEIQK